MNGWIVYRFADDDTQRANNDAADAAVLEEARWVTAAQAAFARHYHDATIYTIGLSTNTALIDQPILRQLANAKSDAVGDTFDPTQKQGAYFYVNNAASLQGAFIAIARKAGAVIVK